MLIALLDGVLGIMISSQKWSLLGLDSVIYITPTVVLQHDIKLCIVTGYQ
jgi:hypothetical protein